MIRANTILGALLLGGVMVGAAQAQLDAIGANPTEGAYPYAAPPGDYAYAAGDPCGAACDPCDPCGCAIAECGACSDPCVPYKLFPEGVFGFDVDMWLESGVYANTYGDHVVSEWSTVQNNDGGTVNQTWLSLKREADGSCGFDWGGGLDFLFGTDAPLTTAFGAPGTWDTTWVGDLNNPNGPDRYGWAMPQLYAEFALGDWTVRGGHFYTSIGYEVFQAPDNHFYSHAYSWYFAEPFTHTGVMVDYNGFDNLSVSAGWVTGWDTAFTNPEDANMVLASVGCDLCDCVSVGYAVNAGHWGETLGELYMHTVLTDIALTDNLHWVIQHDWGHNYSRPAAAADQDWYGVNNYFLYTINDCWSLNNRVEWFNDSDGARTNHAGDYWGYTAGLNWQPCENLIVRPELRYDWYTGQASPFNGGTDKDIFGGGCDVVVTW